MAFGQMTMPRINRNGLEMQVANRLIDFPSVGSIYIPDQTVGCLGYNVESHRQEGSQQNRKSADQWISLVGDV
jgi:hypothetical protein